MSVATHACSNLHYGNDQDDEPKQYHQDSLGEVQKDIWAASHCNTTAHAVAEARFMPDEHGCYEYCLVDPTAYNSCVEAVTSLVNDDGPFIENKLCIELRHDSAWYNHSDQRKEQSMETIREKAWKVAAHSSTVRMFTISLKCITQQQISASS